MPIANFQLAQAKGRMRSGHKSTDTKPRKNNSNFYIFVDDRELHSRRHPSIAGQCLILKIIVCRKDAMFGLSITLFYVYSA
jgi:hypothetical protein